MNGPITISQLPKTDTLSDSDLFPCVVGGTTKNISWGQIKALLEGKKTESWMPTNIGSVYATNAYWSQAYVTNFYVTNLFTTTWVTNDFKPSEAPSHKAIEVMASAIPTKPIFSAGQWWMISFGVLISIVCIIRIAAALRWSKS